MARAAWKAPGFRFFTPEMQAWLGGYQPVMAREFAKPAAGKPCDAEAAERLRSAQIKGSAVWRRTLPKVAK